MVPLFVNPGFNPSRENNPLYVVIVDSRIPPIILSPALSFCTLLRLSNSYSNLICLISSRILKSYDLLRLTIPFLPFFKSFSRYCLFFASFDLSFVFNFFFRHASVSPRPSRHANPFPCKKTINQSNDIPLPSTNYKIRLTWNVIKSSPLSTSGISMIAISAYCWHYCIPLSVRQNERCRQYEKSTNKIFTQTRKKKRRKIPSDKINLARQKFRK